MASLSKPRFLAPLPISEAWESVRRAPRHSDEALTGTTRHWLRRLPPGRRPLRLCTSFPRLANALAWHWSDTATVARILDDLLVDRRGGRAGFPMAVVQELRRLAEIVERPGCCDDAPAPGYLQGLRRFWGRH
jgi:hypothetical protein